MNTQNITVIGTLPSTPSVGLVTHNTLSPNPNTLSKNDPAYQAWLGAYYCALGQRRTHPEAVALANAARETFLREHPETERAVLHINGRAWAVALCITIIILGTLALWYVAAMFGMAVSP